MPIDVFAKPEARMKIDNRIVEFAATINSNLLGIVLHRPEPGALVNHCIYNVIDKKQKDGGEVFFGWTFQHRKCQLGDYLTATHHAIWYSPDEVSTDVTPFNDNPVHHPIHEGDKVLFLLDGTALPPVNDINGQRIIAPLPMKFFALNDDERLLAYLEEVQRKEVESCQAIYEGRLPPGQYTTFASE